MEECPTFTIKATDKWACVAVASWLVMARANHVSPEKLKSAEHTLTAIREWQQKNPTLVKKAD